MRERRKGFGLSIWWVGASISFGKRRCDLPKGGGVGKLSNSGFAVVICLKDI